jgi:hypothetical protein
VLWCPLQFPHKRMFGSSLPLVVCRRAYVLFTVCYLCLCGYSDVKYVLTMRVTWWCLIRGRNCLPFARTLVHPRFVVASVLFIFLVFSAVLFGLFVLFLCLVYPMLPFSLECPSLIAPSSCVPCHFLWIVHLWLPLRYL